MGKWLEEGLRLDAEQAQEEAGVVRGISFPLIHFKNYFIIFVPQIARNVMIQICKMVANSCV